jgi:hypothetical protein
MTCSIVNKTAGYRIDINACLSEVFAGYEARIYNLIGGEYVDAFFFSTIAEAIEFAEDGAAVLK